MAKEKSLEQLIDLLRNGRYQLSREEARRISRSRSAPEWARRHADDALKAMDRDEREFDEIAARTGKW